MARSFPLEEGGSANDVLITDESHDPGCDEGGVRPNSTISESFIGAVRGTICERLEPRATLAMSAQGPACVKT
jgi:hypothetical protein